MIEQYQRVSAQPLQVTATELEELKRRTNELTRLNQHLQDRDRAKSAFLANIAREFRAPLRMLLGPLQYLLDSPASALAAEDLAVLEVAQRNAQSLLELVDKLVDFPAAGGARADTASAARDRAALTHALSGNKASADAGSLGTPAPKQAGAFAAEPLIGGAEPDTASRIERPALKIRGRANGRVMIVDDNAEMRAYLEHLLEVAGFEVDLQPDGAAALAACRVQAPDALLSDVSMPGLDGYALIQQLRADEDTATIPVLLLSGRSSEDARIAGLEAGADDYLIKPLGRRELVARVEGAVRLARLRRETAQRQQADFESLFSLAPDAIIVVGQDGCVLTANGSAQRLFGYSLQEFHGLPVETLMPASFRQAHAKYRESYMRAPFTRIVGQVRELRAARRDGGEFIVEIGLAPLFFKNQQCTVANVRDVTERKQLEAERAEHERRFGELSRRLVEVQEAERRKLSTELHDRTSPGLAAIQINLKMLNHLLRAYAAEDVSAILDDTAGLIADTTLSIREISSNLRPTLLDDGGLLPALGGYAQQFMQRTGILVELETQQAQRALAPAVQSSLFRIVQEALTNCAKHAKAKRVSIRLSTDDAAATLEIADDGVGFNPGRTNAPGLGLLTMRERAEFAGGSFKLESNPGQGTRIRVLV